MGPGQCCPPRRVREGSRCESSHTAWGVGEKLVELFGCRPVFANPAVGCAARGGEGLARRSIGAIPETYRRGPRARGLRVAPERAPRSGARSWLDAGGAGLGRPGGGGAKTAPAWGEAWAA